MPGPDWRALSEGTVDMPVHVAEMHAEVVPAGGSREGRRDGAAEPEWVQEQRLTDAKARIELLRHRVCAEAFDD